MTKALEEKKYREVTPVGYIYAQDKEYYLLSLHPINPDWENELFERRFAVVPVEELSYGKDNVPLYSYARHIVIAGSYLIEYKVTFDPIKVWDLGVIDLSEIDLEPEDLEVEPDPVELMDILREVEETNG